MSGARSLVPYEPQWDVSLADVPGTATLALSTRAPRRIGLVLVFLFLGGFLVWGLTVPIAGGAIAPGVISPDGNRRTVQHLEGGIIAQLRVRDGDKVTAGQPLVLLESLQARAVYNSLLSQYQTLLVMQARLEAEQNGWPEMVLPREIESASAQAELGKLLAAQRFIFSTRRAAQETRTRILHLRIEQSQEQIRAFEAQVRSTADQLALIADELRGKEHLLRSGLVPRPEVLRLQRSQAELLGRQGEYLGTIARTRQLIGETEMQIVSLEADRLDKLSDQIDKVRVELAGVTERLEASRDVLSRTAVLAPITGTVINLRFKTIEGVIKPGEAILDIVPDEEKLLIDARVAPNDIDVVHSGLSAQVRLTAYSSRGLPRIGGVVRSVSADCLQDPGSNQLYYLARVEVDRGALEQLGPYVSLVPGMPAEVLIVRRERTMVRYLIEPFRDAFRRSFREV